MLNEYVNDKVAENLTPMQSSKRGCTDLLPIDRKVGMIVLRILARDPNCHIEEKE